MFLIRVETMLFVETLTAFHRVLVCQISKDFLQIVVPNAQSIKTVRQTWHVLILDVAIHVQAVVDKMLCAQYSTISRHVHVLQAFLVTLLLGVI